MPPKPKRRILHYWLIPTYTLTDAGRPRWRMACGRILTIERGTSNPRLTTCRQCKRVLRHTRREILP